MTGMAGYTKLFNSILASSVWRTSLEVKVLWITLLAMADKNGVANAAIPGLAALSGLSIEATEEGLEELMAPDRYSRTKSNEGRRIEPVDGGWRLLNHAKYRAQMSADDRRAYKAQKQRQYRAEAGGHGVDNESTGGQRGHNAKAKAKAKATTDTEAKERKTDTRKELEAEKAIEEQRLSENLTAIRDSGRDIQTVLDALPRSPSRSAFSAHTWLRSGRSGFPTSGPALVALRMLNDSLEGYERAKDAPIISANNAKAFDAADRVLERITAKRDGKTVPLEIEG